MNQHPIVTNMHSSVNGYGVKEELYDQSQADVTYPNKVHIMFIREERIQWLTFILSFKIHKIFSLIYIYI